jgi:uncharacterized membrane protein (DUF2068 family)
VHKQRPTALRLIVLYKCFEAILFFITATAAIFVMKNHEDLAEFASSYILTTKIFIIKWLVNKFLTIDPNSLKLSGIVAGVYALVTAIEAIGLWYEQDWAILLVLGLVGISIPPEIFELIRGITVIKLLVFSINMAMFIYLLRHVITTRSRNRSD